ncbi:ABC transporter ATP-binding protein [Nocardia sp. NPDC049707]|uniref:ABC transporter ATP-binding protein n=1 Tax=Nocardia sp. NPDC049707 TaxID=3154735 RepID=UPI0034280CA0
MNAILQIDDVSKRYDGRSGPVQAVGSISIEVRADEFVSVVGPSGCGKTTLLRCISGLLAPSTGATRLNGKVVTGPPSEMAVVFQDYARSLFPWMTVAENVDLPIRRRRERAERESLVTESLKAVGLTDFARHYPWQLSGGMQQRVAIARALAYQPQVLLMDEPFASVDAQTRAELEDVVLDVKARFGMTVLLVTHDIDEAVYMSDRVIVLSKPPSTVQTNLTVDLPFPRDQVATKEHPEFAQLRSEIYLEITQGHMARETVRSER